VLVQVAQAAHAQPVTLVVHAQLAAQVVRVVHLVLVSVAEPVALSVLVSVVALQVLVPVQPASAALVHRVAQVPAVAVTVVELLVRSVRAEAVVPRRPASRSARNAKSLNREWLRALVAQLCHVATELP
jgi:hypothetical protein